MRLSGAGRSEAPECWHPSRARCRWRPDLGLTGHWHDIEVEAVECLSRRQASFFEMALNAPVGALGDLMLARAARKRAAGQRSRSARSASSGQTSSIAGNRRSPESGGRHRSSVRRSAFAVPQMRSRSCPGSKAGGYQFLICTERVQNADRGQCCCVGREAGAQDGKIGDSWESSSTSRAPASSASQGPLVGGRQTLQRGAAGEAIEAAFADPFERPRHRPGGETVARDRPDAATQWDSITCSPDCEAAGFTEE